MRHDIYRANDFASCSRNAHRTRHAKCDVPVFTLVAILAIVDAPNSPAPNSAVAIRDARAGELSTTGAFSSERTPA